MILELIGLVCLAIFLLTIYSIGTNLIKSKIEDPLPEIQNNRTGASTDFTDNSNDFTNTINERIRELNNQYSLQNQRRNAFDDAVSSTLREETSELINNLTNLTQMDRNNAYRGESISSCPSQVSSGLGLDQEMGNPPKEEKEEVVPPFSSDNAINDIDLDI